MAEVGGEVVGTLMAATTVIVDRGLSRCSSGLSRGGIANALGEPSGKKLIARAVRKSIMVRAENDAVVSMYEKLGYEISDTLLLGKRLIEDQEY